MKSVREKLQIALLMVTTIGLVCPFIYAVVTYTGWNSMNPSPSTEQNVGTYVTPKCEYIFKVNNNGPQTTVSVHRWYKLYGKNKNVVVVPKTWCNSDTSINGYVTNWSAKYIYNHGSSVYLNETGRWHHETLHGCSEIGFDNAYKETWFTVK